MKYLKIFISILYLVIGSLISFINPILAYRNILLFDFPLLPQIFFIATLIGFFIYLVRIKDNSLYWSIFFLALTVNYCIIIIFSISNKINDYFLLDANKSHLNKAFIPYIITWIFIIIITIGFSLLHLYFKNKYRKKSKDEESNLNPVP